MIQIEKIFYVLLIVALIYGCTPNAENRLNEGIELYKNGEIEKATKYIEKSLIDSADIKNFKENDLLYGGNVLYHRGKNLEIVWPIELDIKIDNSYNIISYDPESMKLGLSNGFDIKIYDYNGKLIKTSGSVQDDKPLIKAIIITKEKLYYYKDKRIYVYDLVSDNEQLLTDNQFFKPFKDDTYNVRFYKAENILTIVIGVAGIYNLNLIDLVKNSVVLQNLKTASSKILLKNNELYYISGNAGKYSLVEMKILSRKKKNLVDFDNLLDIEFFDSGIIYENKEGLWIFKYDGTYTQKIPFHYELYGGCSYNPILKYSNIYYVLDMAGLINKMAYIKEAIPIFDNTDKEQ